MGSAQTDTVVVELGMGLANRSKIVDLELAINNGVKESELEDAVDKCILTHYFAPIVDEYQCGTYARELFMPKGTIIVGKIHKHAHLNIISKGKVIVVTEDGKKDLEAPCTFVSPAGVKRAVYILEDTIWTTVHLTKDIGEDNLDKIEEEIITETFLNIGTEEDISTKIGVKS